jgi:hypothetical protein
MSSATERQPIPLVDPQDLAVTAIVAQLDAMLATLAITKPSCALLPDAENWQLVDLTVRQWATLHRCQLREWEQDTCQGYEICTFVGIHERRILTVHRPEEYWPQNLKPVYAEAPRVLVDADTLWSPAS